MNPVRRFVGVLALLGLFSTCSNADAPQVGLGGAERALSGGAAATVSATVANPLGQSVIGLSREQRRQFSVGNNFFNDNWVTAPASTVGRDGLGPLFNAQSCSSCHQFDGRAAPPMSNEDPTRGLLLRLSVIDAEGSPVPDPVYGGQLQDRSINGVKPEGTINIDYTEIPGTYADGSTYTLMAPTYSISNTAYGALAEGLLISPRIAPAVFGVGLLEAVPNATLEELSDASDTDGDGISGRVNQVFNEAGQLVPGRFGWKSNVATVKQQNAGAFNGDVGVTTTLHPEQNCTATQAECLVAPNGGEPEVDNNKLQRVTFYTRTLAVPERRDVGAVDTDAGEATFVQLGCASCHLSTIQTGPSDIPALANQTIRPYTDLLLHDMGAALADGRPDALATGSEWRTAPLWGIGLIDDVNDHTRFLHDGRARNLEEAILWHGGEALAAQQAFLQLNSQERRALIIFLGSL